MAGLIPERAAPSHRGLWWRAFVGFYPPQDPSVRQLDPVVQFLYSARSVILVISAQAAIIAGLLALTDHHFQLGPFILVLIGFVVAHMISNLSNDYFGYRRGHDTPDSPRMRYTVHPVASGVLAARTLAIGVSILAVIGAAIAVYFWVLRGSVALAFALAGIALLYLYDASPKTLKSVGLGEVASFLVWGPLMVGGGYFVITDMISSTAFLASVPYGLGVMSILVGKHIDQSGFDRSHSQRTLPVVLGESRARQFNRGVIVLMYILVAALILIGRLSPFAALVAVALPRAGRALSTMGRPRPSEPPVGYVGWPLWYHRVCLVHNRLFGWTYIVGLAMGALFPNI